MNNYQIVTVSNRTPTAWYYLQGQFYASLKGHEVLTINHPNEPWGGLMTKPRWLYKAIKNGTINKKYIIFPDNWDLVFCASPDEVMTRFFSFGAPVVVSCESNCFPADFKEDFDKVNPPTKYKYLNSGFIVGETEAILACLEAMELPNIPDDHYDPVKNCNVHPNDQREWQSLWVRQPVLIILDYSQALCQTLHDANIDEFDLSGERIINKITGSYPCAFHFNGGSKDNMSLRGPILQKLNLV
jgi:hypothetical protein